MRVFAGVAMTDQKAGALVGLALVSEEGVEFYQTLTPRQPFSQWAADNVKPVLGKGAIKRREFWARLDEYLSRFETVDMVVRSAREASLILAELGDHPPLTVHVVGTVGAPETPYNALSEARAMMEVC